MNRFSLPSPEPRHRPVLFSRTTGILVVLALSAALPARAEVQLLTRQPVGDSVVQLNNAGQVAWRAGLDLFLWNNGRTQQLTDVTNNAYVPSLPNTDPSSNDLPWHLSDTGQVVW